MSIIQEKTDLEKILESKDWLSSIRYHSGRIIEYDIKSANANVLYREGAISKETYDYLIRLPKIEREIAVGKMEQRDSALYHTLMNGIFKLRRQLIEENNIQEEEIVRVATDAIYINRFDNLKYTKFDNVTFVPKSEYSNMMILLDLIVFSRYINNNIDIDVKGLGNSMQYHQQYMLSLIANVIYMFERVSLLDSIRYLTQMYEQYVKLQLPIGFYRELNPYSGYRVKNMNMVVFEGSDVNMVDIGYNIRYLRELHNILFENFH